MSFVGKILVVVQLVLSVLFVSFAAAVNTAHVNWRKEAIKAQDQVKKVQSELNDEKQNLETAKAQFKSDTDKAEARATAAEAKNVDLEDQVKKALEEVKNAQRESAVANEQAQIAREEAKFRREETVTQREDNTRLLASRDELFKSRRDLYDQVEASKVDLEVARSRNKELLQQLALRDRKLSELGISPDDPSLVANISVPPRVEGKVTGTQGVKAVGRSELIEISLGSDAGLVKGHELFVWRSGLSAGGKVKYLGKIRIDSTEKDRAVATVLEKDRGGEIEKGDNVSTRLQ
jgi:hypothetical protein